MKAKGAVREAILRMVEKIRVGYDPERIILFGSYAYGEPTEDSDIDLLVVKDDPRRRLDRAVEISRLVREENGLFPVEILVCTPREVEHRLAIGDDFLQEIVTSGEVLYVRSLTVAGEWFQRGEQDLVSARLILTHGGPPSAAGDLLQQAVDKHLKGFLLYHGWKLKRIHDLIPLLREAQQYLRAVADFADDCRKITRLYVEQRYPPFGEHEITREEVAALLGAAEELIRMLKGAVEAT